MRELLSDFGYDGNTVPMICGSALKALNGDETEYGKYLSKSLLILKVKMFYTVYCIMNVMITYMER